METPTDMEMMEETPTVRYRSTPGHFTKLTKEEEAKENARLRAARDNMLESYAKDPLKILEMHKNDMNSYIMSEESLNKRYPDRNVLFKDVAYPVAMDAGDYIQIEVSFAVDVNSAILLEKTDGGKVKTLEHGSGWIFLEKNSTLEQTEAMIGCKFIGFTRSTFYGSYCCVFLKK
jgi:hypothetical protein